MSKIALTPNASGTGTLTVAAPNTNTDRTLTLPDATTTLVGTDATQTLTNKTIAASQLTGALPAIDGSALTGIATGGMTLLGTLATTSGTSVTLSGLNLTSYKQLSVVINGVSSAAVANAFLLLNSQNIAKLYNISVLETAYGVATIDLTTGAFGIIQTTDYFGTKYVNYFGGLSGLSTASTSITFTITAGGATFDAGSIVIYGVK